MKYRNCGYTTVNCYGVEFRPGDVKEVPGVINLRNFVEVFDVQAKEKPSPNAKSTRRSSKVVEPNIESKAEKPVEDIKVEKEEEKEGE